MLKTQWQTQSITIKGQKERKFKTLKYNAISWLKPAKTLVWSFNIFLRKVPHVIRLIWKSGISGHGENEEVVEEKQDWYLELCNASTVHLNSWEMVYKSTGVKDRKPCHQCQRVCTGASYLHPLRAGRELRLPAGAQRALASPDLKGHVALHPRSAELAGGEGISTAIMNSNCLVFSPCYGQEEVTRYTRPALRFSGRASTLRPLGSWMRTLPKNCPETILTYFYYSELLTIANIIIYYLFLLFLFVLSYTFSIA